MKKINLQQMNKGTAKNKVNNFRTQHDFFTSCTPLIFREQQKINDPISGLELLVVFPCSHAPY